MSEMSSIGRDEWPAITMVVFRNYQWRAEKRNTTLWYDDNFVGTELNLRLSYAKVAEACGLKGVVARSPDALTRRAAASPPSSRSFSIRSSASRSGATR
jgi:sulfoacetaldehyde acetyltransferase